MVNGDIKYIDTLNSECGTFHESRSRPVAGILGRGGGLAVLGLHAFDGHSSGERQRWSVKPIDKQAAGCFIVGPREVRVIPRPGVKETCLERVGRKPHQKLGFQTNRFVTHRRHEFARCNGSLTAAQELCGDPIVLVHRSVCGDPMDPVSS